MTMRGVVVASVFSCAAFAQGLGPGSRVPEFDLERLDGGRITFSALRGPVTVVAFISTVCPVSNGFNDRMAALFEDYSRKGVKFVFINSNANESPAQVAQHHTAAGFPSEVYKDTDNRAADLFGAMSTPEMYMADRGGVIRYHGYIEDSINPARVKHRALREALEAVLAGKPVTAAETKAFGCSIKRARRTT